ncbi:S-protein homolog 28-like [Cornus florida]|uniref:S-protein homolog 28-like n=1 Tax=Cornus florida TaxID=4283 RepID=UPI00289955A9|nr:S-protein homolog 28-like [Cornus florida]
MTFSNKCPILLALFIVPYSELVFSASLDATDDSIFHWPKITVIIYNDLEEGVNLNVHCKSRNDDLGKNVSGVYDTYVAGRDICNKCVWKAKKDGLHGYEDFGSDLESFFFKWGKTPAIQDINVGEKKN